MNLNNDKKVQLKDLISTVINKIYNNDSGYENRYRYFIDLIKEHWSEKTKNILENIINQVYIKICNKYNEYNLENVFFKKANNQNNINTTTTIKQINNYYNINNTIHNINITKQIRNTKTTLYNCIYVLALYYLLDTIHRNTDDKKINIIYDIFDSIMNYHYVDTSDYMFYNKINTFFGNSKLSLLVINILYNDLKASKNIIDIDQLYTNSKNNTGKNNTLTETIKVNVLKFEEFYLYMKEVEKQMKINNQTTKNISESIQPNNKKTRLRRFRNKINRFFNRKTSKSLIT